MNENDEVANLNLQYGKIHFKKVCAMHDAQVLMSVQASIQVGI